MNTNATPNPKEEIDLAAVSKKINGLTQNVKDFIFNCILFVIKYKIILAVLFVTGAGIGMYLDKTNKSYDHQLVVTPNFGSADYLYDKIDLIEAKIKENDTVFLKAIGIQPSSKLGSIEIDPIVDIYPFVNNNSERNFELLRLMAEDSDIKKTLEEKITSKNYTYHLITFTTRKKTTDEKTTKPILDFLNNSAFYTKVQREELKNTQIRMKANDVILAQIDNFLNGIGTGKGSGEKLVYYNENSPLNDIIQTKERIVREQGNLRTSMITTDKIIKNVSQVLNIENKESVNGKLKIMLPILFIFMFVAIHQFLRFYKEQTLKRKANIS